MNVEKKLQLLMSHELNSAQRYYSASEQSSLGTFLAVEKFRAYL